MSPRKAAPRCARCGRGDLLGPAPLRTSAHPNSSFLLLETPGAHYHDHTVQGVVCLDCGAVEASVSPTTLARLREESGRSAAPAKRRSIRKRRAP